MKYCVVYNALFSSRLTGDRAVLPGTVNVWARDKKAAKIEALKKIKKDPIVPHGAEITVMDVFEL